MKQSPQHSTENLQSPGATDTGLSMLAKVTKEPMDTSPRLSLREDLPLQQLVNNSIICEDRLRAVSNGEAVPTIGFLWKIANALNVPFGKTVHSRRPRGTFVLRKGERQTFASSDRRFVSQAVFTFPGSQSTEFYEVTIAPSHTETSKAHASGTVENLVVTRGQIEIKAGKEQPQRLKSGDTIVFEADVPHSYKNVGKTEAVFFVAVTYIDVFKPDAINH
jgi:quercetin dioxygenase-like cupin family protein